MTGRRRLPTEIILVIMKESSIRSQINTAGIFASAAALADLTQTSSPYVPLATTPGQPIHLMAHVHVENERSALRRLLPIAFCSRVRRCNALSLPGPSCLQHTGPGLANGAVGRDTLAVRIGSGRLSSLRFCLRDPALID